MLSGSAGVAARACGRGRKTTHSSSMTGSLCGLREVKNSDREVVGGYVLSRSRRLRIVTEVHRHVL
jgi:hypothetical protein